MGALEYCANLPIKTKYENPYIYMYTCFQTGY